MACWLQEGMLTHAGVPHERCAPGQARAARVRGVWVFDETRNGATKRRLRRMVKRIAVTRRQRRPRRQEINSGVNKVPWKAVVNGAVVVPVVSLDLAHPRVLPLDRFVNLARTGGRWKCGLHHSSTVCEVRAKPDPRRQSGTSSADQMELDAGTDQRGSVAMPCGMFIGGTGDHPFSLSFIEEGAGGCECPLFARSGGILRVVKHAWAVECPHCGYWNVLPIFRRRQS